MSANGSAVAAARLACLPKMTPGRMRALVDHFGSALQALVAVTDGRAGEATLTPERAAAMKSNPSDLAGEWQRALGSDVTAARLARRGTLVWVDGAPEYPITEPIPDRPPVLLAEGARPDAIESRRVAVVGTRAATPHGLADARELGTYLATAGITVVSGMAIGIDGATHEGALDAEGLAVGVVATGLDVEYPRRHRSLYERVRANGVIVGETAFGVRPDRWRFPIRNRIIAALAEVVVVVEATLTGGARITAQYALEYGRTVLAVPGSRRNRAARGTNELIADGAQPLLEWSDVLVALGLSDGNAPALHAPARPTPSADGTALLRALAGEMATPDQLASRAALTPERIAVALFELERTGWIDRAQGGIWPR